jgi:asparagine synthetase B (glutamine-hydrolysing)
MCGITGFWNFSNSVTPEELISVITGMGDIIRHRGPDDSGEWVDEGWVPPVFGVWRFSIIPWAIAYISAGRCHGI